MLGPLVASLSREKAQVNKNKAIRHMLCTLSLCPPGSWSLGHYCCKRWKLKDQNGSSVQSPSCFSALVGSTVLTGHIPLPLLLLFVLPSLLPPTASGENCLTEICHKLPAPNPTLFDNRQRPVGCCRAPRSICRSVGSSTLGSVGITLRGRRIGPALTRRTGLLLRVQVEHGPHELGHLSFVDGSSRDRSALSCETRVVTHYGV